MKKAIRVIKKGRGRPRTTGTGTLVGVRLQEPSLELIDRWAAVQPDRPGRPEAIRRLIDAGLAGFRGRQR